MSVREEMREGKCVGGVNGLEYTQHNRNEPLESKINLTDLHTFIKLWSSNLYRQYSSELDLLCLQASPPHPQCEALGEQTSLTHSLVLHARGIK